MNSTPVPQFLSLVGPILLAMVYLFGIVYALVNLSKARGPAIMALLGCAIILMMMVGQQVFFRTVVTRPGFDHQMMPVLMSAMAVPAAVGHALIIVAVFAGRREN
tara:strand:- start:179 stop:493 length:315 start_codon:yes stop_codon:yes gene_type:complete